MRSDHDTELGTIFREMRRAMGVSRERIAGRLATPVETIDILESGDLLALPEWSEVTRVVTAYTAQLGLDSRPILRRMQAQIGALKPAGPADTGLEESVAASATPASATPASPDPAPTPEPAVAAPDANVSGTDFVHAGPATENLADDADFLPQPTMAEVPTAEPEKPALAAKLKGTLSGLLRATGSWLLLIGLIGVLGYGLWFASQNPRAVWSAVDSLPAPLPGAMRGAWELVRPFDDPETRPQVFDPDKRKSNKLP